MKKFFGSAKTLFLLLLLLSRALPVTATTNQIKLIVHVHNSDLRKTGTETSFHNISLANKQDYINQVLKVLKEQHPKTDFFFPWEDKNSLTRQFELNALARSSFPITKQCPKKLVINSFKEGTFTQNLKNDPVAFFKESENWDERWGKRQGGSATTSTVSKNEPPLPFTTTSERARTDNHTDRENHTNPDNNSNKVSRRGNKDQKKGGTLLKYGGALLLVSILTGGCYALYQSLSSQKRGRSEQEEEQEAVNLSRESLVIK